MAITNGPKRDLMVNGIQGEEHYSQLMRLLRGLDALIQCSVVSHTINVPPTTGLVDGVCYIIGPGATGSWFGRTGQLARFSSLLVEPGWEYFPTGPGFVAYSEALGEHIMQNADGDWVSLRTGLPFASGTGDYVAVLGSATLPLPNAMLADEPGTFVRAGLAYASGKPPSFGKRFFEFRSPDSAAGNANIAFGFTTLEGGIADFDEATVAIPDSFGYVGGLVQGNSNVYGNFGALLASGAGAGTIFSNQIVGFAVDLEENKFWYQINGGSWYGGGDPELGTGGFDAGTEGVYDLMVPFAIVYAANYEVYFTGKSADMSLPLPDGFVGWDD